MCLKTHNRTIYVAHGHKTCYKLLLSDGEGHMFTPYCRTYVPPEVLDGKKNFEAKGKPAIDTYSNCDMISGGYIHTFQFKSDALVTSELWAHPHIYKCVIPDKRRYRMGKDDADTPCFASKVIKFVEEIDETKGNKTLYEESLQS